MLGSTIAHEIVHHHQSYFVVLSQNLQSRMGIIKKNCDQDVEYGTWLAEHEAYMYTYNNADKFGLTETEKNDIIKTLHHYYPLECYN